MKWTLKTPVQLLLLGLTSVFPTLFGPFIFDDSEAILNNEDVTSQSGCKNITQLAQVFLNDFWGSPITHRGSHKSYRPFTTLTYRLDYCIWGLNPFPFHLINWIIHGINCILVFHFLHACFLFQKVNGTPIIPYTESTVIFWASILFCVHPIHIEPLGGLVGRADLLSSMIFLLGFIKASSLDVYTIRVTILVPVISILGALFKETCIVLMIFYLSLLLLQRRSHPFSYRLLAYNSISLAITSSFVIWRLWFQDGSPVFQKFDNPPAFADSWFSKVFSGVYIWILNVWILMNPTWLCFDWSMGCLSLVESINDLRFFLVILSMLIAVVALLRLRSRTICLASVIGLTTFLPSSNLIFTVGFVIAERNLYLPSIGFCLVLSHCFLKFPKGKSFLAVIASLYFVRSVHRSLDWIQPERLYLSGLNVCPNNAKVHYNIGAVQAELGKTQLAIASYAEALRLKDDYYQAMNNLGNILRSSQDLKGAEFWLRKAVKTKVDFPAAWMNLGIVLSKQNASEAMDCYQEAMKYRKYYPDCIYNMGNLYLDAKNYSFALKFWIRVTALQPSHIQSWLNIIILLEHQHRFLQAKIFGQKAMDAGLGGEHSILFVLGNVHGRLEEYEVAEKYFREAIGSFEGRQVPAKYWSNLGVLYHRWGKFEAASQCYRKALLIQPNMKSARENLSKLGDLLKKTL